MTADVIQLFPAIPAIDGQLALPLTWEVAPGVPAVPPVPRQLRLVAPPAEPTPESLVTPEPAWVAQLARAVSEVGAGDRPPGQLTRWVEHNELTRLAARGRATANHPSVRMRRAQLTSERARRQVRAVRICPIRPGVVETSAVLVGTGRGQAIAMRMEQRHDRWIVTALSLG